MEVWRKMLPLYVSTRFDRLDLRLADLDGDGWEEVVTPGDNRLVIRSGATGATLAEVAQPPGWSWCGCIRDAGPGSAGVPRLIFQDPKGHAPYRGYALLEGDRLELLWEERDPDFALETVHQTDLDRDGKADWCLFGMSFAGIPQERRHALWAEARRQWRWRRAGEGASQVLAEDLDDPCHECVPQPVPDQPGTVCVPVGPGKVGLYDLAKQTHAVLDVGARTGPSWAGRLEAAGPLFVTFGGHRALYGGGTLSGETELYRLSGGRMEQVWVNRRGGSSHSPRLADLDRDGVADLVVVGMDSWSLTAISGTDGRTLWLHALDEEVEHPLLILPGDGVPRLYVRTRSRHVLLEGGAGRNEARWVAGFGSGFDGALR